MDEKLERTFSSEYGSKRPMQSGDNSPLCLSAGSTLIARQSCYGGTSITISPRTESEGGDTVETDTTQLLSEKLKKKKQGRVPALSNNIGAVQAS